MYDYPEAGDETRTRILISEGVETIWIYDRWDAISFPVSKIAVYDLFVAASGKSYVEGPYIHPTLAENLIAYKEETEKEAHARVNDVVFAEMLRERVSW